MTDLELNKACAEAMGLRAHQPQPNPRLYHAVDGRGMAPYVVYSPLTDDAQAMALVKRFNISIINASDLSEMPHWWGISAGGTLSPRLWRADLNRAIVEAVAAMHVTEPA